MKLLFLRMPSYTMIVIFVDHDRGQLMVITVMFTMSEYHEGKNAGVDVDVLNHIQISQKNDQDGLYTCKCIKSLKVSFAISNLG